MIPWDFLADNAWAMHDSTAGKFSTLAEGEQRLATLVSATLDGATWDFLHKRADVIRKRIAKLKSRGRTA